MKDLFIIVLASGAGRRFGKQASLPKQLLRIGAKPVVWFSLHAALQLTPPENVLLTYPPGMKKTFESLLKKNKWNFRLIEGGKRRQDSVLNAFRHIQHNKGIVLIHDSARPLASARLFKTVYEGAKKNGACIPVIKSPDTVKEIKNGFIEKTINREVLGLAQTPQGFKIDILRKTFSKLDGKKEYTDEAGLLEASGRCVAVAAGERHNLKLTFQEDLAIIKTLMKLNYRGQP